MLDIISPVTAIFGSNQYKNMNHTHKTTSIAKADIINVCIIATYATLDTQKPIHHLIKSFDGSETDTRFFR